MDACPKWTRLRVVKAGKARGKPCWRCRGCGSYYSDLHMNPTSPFRRVAFAALAAVAGLGFGLAARAQQTNYRAITPTMEHQTITLDGHTMTADQLVAIARDGAQVAITDEARQREADQYALVLEA